MSAAAEQAVLRAAVERGFLTQAQVASLDPEGAVIFGGSQQTRTRGARRLLGDTWEYPLGEEEPR